IRIPYYAVYLEARGYCEAYPGHSREKSAREHQVIAALLRSIEPELDVERRFLRRARNEADSEDQLPSDYRGDLLERTVISSTWIFERLDRLPRGGYRVEKERKRFAVTVRGAVLATPAAPIACRGTSG